MAEETPKHEKLTDVELLIRFESQKKSAIVGAVLNSLIPGAGYFYCGDAVIGLVLLVVGVALGGFFIIGAVTSGGIPIALALIWFISGVMFALGAIAVSRHNKALADKLLGATTPSAPPANG